MIYDKDLDQWNPGAHIGTFRGNQMAMAAGTATLKYIKETNLLDHVEALGQRMQANLKDIQNKCLLSVMCEEED